MNLNFKISELIHSDMAVIKKINNMPDVNALDNMLLLIVNCLQPIRDLFNRPIIITSGFRCKLLNKLVGGACNSQHTKGEAVDFKIKGMSVKKIVDIIKKSDITFDQLINEHDAWVHISYSKNNKKQTLYIK